VEDRTKVTITQGCAGDLSGRDRDETETETETYLHLALQNMHQLNWYKLKHLEMT